MQFGWFYGFLVLLFQGSLPLNPDGNPSMTADLAFNTAISFIVNCNLQHYSGETGVSYFSQVFVLMFFQFVSAATGMAAAAVLFNALRERTTTQLGNFYNYFMKSMTRILLPLCLVVAVVLLINGTPMTWEGKDTVITLQGDTVQVSRGPVAPFVAIKHLGTNGGGFFGVNSAHPLESPNYITNVTEMVAQLIIPFAMIFAFGFYLNRKKLSSMIFGVMTVGFLVMAIPNVILEMQGNPAIDKMGVDQSLGAMEGKEVRFGTAASGFWSVATTVISTGSVNAMHDSSMPLSGMNELLAMMVNSFYGGVGVGILNFFIFIIISVFIAGLMVGRTPEFLGKKIEAREMKIAVLITLLSPLLILGGTALAAYLTANDTAMGWWFSGNATGWLNNPGYHGFSEMLYEFTSANANNGSGFEGLGDNNPFWNITTGIVLILGRYLPIIGPVAIAGLMAGKKYIPEGAGTLKTDTLTFGAMILAVIFIVTALLYFPALALGPIAEHFSML
jgi:K+-transporting ATPase ATPase A chain